MSSALRMLAPFVLLLASLLGQAASAHVLLHLATDHAVEDTHDERHGEHDRPHHNDPDGSHHDHSAGQSQDANHGAQHSHDLMSATAAPARAAQPNLALQPLALLSQHVSGLPDWYAVFLPAIPAQRAGPPKPKRCSILLL